MAPETPNAVIQARQTVEVNGVKVKLDDDITFVLTKEKIAEILGLKNENENIAIEVPYGDEVIKVKVYDISIINE